MKLHKMMRRRRNPAAEFATDNAPLLLAGAAVGAALVYLSTGRGKRHGTMAYDKPRSALRSGAEAIGSRARDLRNRSRGVAHDLDAHAGTANGRNATVAANG